MREIKFRAWVVDEFEEDGNTPKSFKMVLWDRYFFSDMSPVTGFSGEFPNEDDSCCILMQFTGLKDRNGKEIYEGDIVIWYVNDVTRTGIVEYIDGYGGYDLKHVDDEYHVGCDWLRGEIEVIGNIYENPEKP